MGSRKYPASVKHADIRAATFRVALDPDSDADYYGVAGLVQALADLPPEGGTVFVGEGRFPISATIVLPDKPVRIIGSGEGATIFDLGDNGIALFEIFYDQPYVFEEFTILGNSTVTQQSGFHFTGTLGNQEVLIHRVSTVPVDYDTSRLITDLILVDTGKLAWVTARDLNLGVTGLYLNGDADLEMHSCIDLTGTGGGFVGSGTSISGTLRIYGSVLNVLTASTVGAFEAVYTDFSCASATHAFQVSGRVGLYGCNFQGMTSVVRFLDILEATEPTSIVGCYFLGYTTEAIRLARSNAYIAGNVNCLVTETGAADSNHYTANHGFSGSTIIGTLSRVGHDRGVRSVNADTTLNETYDDTVLVDASGGARTITLPTAASMKHRGFTIKKIDSSTNAVTIAPTGGDLIDGAANLQIGSPMTARTIISDGSAWWVV